MHTALLWKRVLSLQAPPMRSNASNITFISLKKSVACNKGVQGVLTCYTKLLSKVYGPAMQQHDVCALAVNMHKRRSICSPAYTH
jgi:hypothetical protein